uniref:Uncharacterized protein n=1 Tax=Anguilla anguilla TaxID=7936 RepID=A0A0E9T741_ANGAN
MNRLCQPQYSSGFTPDIAWPKS